MTSPAALPTGTVTFLFTDIEGSTRLVQSLGSRWRAVLETHEGLIRRAIAGTGGVVVRTEGDAVFAAFADAGAGVNAAIAAQRALTEHPWDEDAVIRVRMGLHSGVGEPGGSDYVGIDVHRAARVAATGHGGQIVISEATAALVERLLPDGAELVDLGKHRLKDLGEAETLFQVSVPGLPAQFPPLATLERVSHNLPVQVTSFVGRDDEIAAALGLLERSRIVTLLGPGGTGKTRLSLQVAAEASDRYRDGVYFVALATVGDPELVPSAILGALGIPAASGKKTPREHLLDFLAGKRILLVLDNFEHLLAAAPLVGDLARVSSESAFLVTSRIPLRVTGEHELPVPPLALDDDAVVLFAERARAIDPGFEVTPENRAAVEHLVARLDGLPLAIELVVPRLRVLPVAEIADRLDLRTVGGGARDLPERHQTLWNAVAWSYETLDETARTLFRHFSVFEGGARLEEIEVVCDTRGMGIDLLDGLGVLIENSLIRRVMRSGGPRFEMLTVIREQARHLLEESGEAPAVRDRHAAAYREFARNGRYLLGRDRRRWIDAFSADHDNLRQALHQLIAVGAVEDCLGMVWDLWRFWQIKGHTYEARRSLDTVLAMPGGSAMARAKAEEASAGIAWWQGDLERAYAIYRDLLPVQRELGDPGEIANALYNFGLTVAFEGSDPGAGEAALREAEAIFEGLGDANGLGNVHWGLGNMWIYRMDRFDDSLALLERTAREYREAGNLFGEGWAHFEAGNALIRAGRHAEAEPHLRAGLELLWDSGDESAVVLFVMLFAGVAGAAGDWDRAYRLAGAGLALRDRSGLGIIDVEENQLAGFDGRSLEALEGADRAALEAGRALSTAEAVALALSR